MKEINNLKKIINSVRYQTQAKQEENSAHSRYKIFNKDYRRTLIHNAPFLFSCDNNDHLEFKKNYSIIIEDDIITDVLPAKKVNKKNFDLIYDAGKRSGVVITPGFVNTHSHIHMYLMRTAMMLDEGENIDETIAAMPKWQKHETDANMTIASIGDLTEQQKSGITTTLTHGPSFAAAETAALATQHNLINAVSTISNSRPENTPEMVEKILQKKDNFFSAPALAIHYLYKADKKQLEKIQKIVTENNALLTFHMAESEFVAKENIKKHGMRETDLLQKFNLLNQKSLASHVLHVNKKEIKMLAKSKIGISHLPTSNVTHKSGIFKFWEFYKEQAFPRMSLGTDSVVSKSRLDILSEAYQTRLMHLYSQTVKFGSLFKMMTINGAKVLNMSNRGRLTPGHKADIVFWKLKDRGFMPYDEKEPFTLLGNMITHGGRSARDLMINGRFVIKNRIHQLINESRLLEEIQKAHMQVRSKMK